MLKNKIKTLVILFFFLVFFTLPNFALANENFDTTLITTYSVSREGQATVEHLFKIKNLTPEYFINKYGLQLSNPSIDNINVYHFEKKITPEIVTTENETSVGINFEKQVVGEGKTNQFKIVYQDNDIAQINGQVLEINIPKLANADEYNRREVKLVTPIYYGFAQRINLSGAEISQDGLKVITYFKNPGGEAISALFGTEQIYLLKLEYHLDNDTSNLGIAQITLPPDTLWQKLNYQILDPKPADIKIDVDGNWIATYRIPPATSTIVKAEALAKLSINTNPDFSYISPLKEHFNEQKYWPTNNKQIQQLANEQADIRTIYNFVVDTLDYTNEDISKKLERLGALNTLEKPTKATCQEFTDVFITLARAKQIAARRITGYAYSSNEKLRPLSLNQDILHAWPEYFDKQKNQWVAVDPTWEDTTGGVDYFNQFDLNHIVFAINGVDSALPFPAGSYKKESDSSKTISVEFANQFPKVDPSFEIELKKRQSPFAFLPGLYELQIINQTGTAWYQLKLKLNTNDGVVVEKNIKLNNFTLLPYQNLKLPLIIYNKQNWLIKNSKISINLNKQEYEPIIQEFAIKIAPKVHHWVYNPIFFASLGIGGIVFSLIAGSVLVFRRKK